MKTIRIYRYTKSGKYIGFLDTDKETAKSLINKPTLYIYSKKKS